MKKILFSIIITIIAAFSSADNIMQFTGGNYIYAENGRLIFNLEPNVFEARTWTYDPNIDGAVTSFRVNNLPLKTQYTSEWYGYEVRQKSQFHYASYSNHQNPWANYSIRPVYRQKVFLPAAGWFIAVGGTIMRSVLPPIIKKCVTNAKCMVTAAHAAGIACNLAYYGYVSLPFGICQQAEADGYKKDADGKYVIKYSYYISTNVTSGHIPVRSIGAGKKKIQNLCTEFASSKNLSISKIDEGSSHYYCYFTDKEGKSAGGVQGVIGSTPISEIKPIPLTMVDLQNYASKDFKKNPMDYVNCKGPMCDDVLDSINVTESAIKRNELGGSFSVVGSEPYRDPKTGKTLQDMLTVDNATTSSNSKPSGNAKDKTPGTSVTNNNVSVTHIERPDKEPEAGVGHENNANGTHGTGSNGNGTGNGGSDGDDDKDDDKGDCKEEGGGTLHCTQLGNVSNGMFDGIAIPIKTDDRTWVADTFLPPDGVCPEPKKFTVQGHTFEIPYDSLCELMKNVRFIILVAFILMSAYVSFGALRGK